MKFVENPGILRKPGMAYEPHLKYFIIYGILQNHIEFYMLICAEIFLLIFRN